MRQSGLIGAIRPFYEEAQKKLGDTPYVERAIAEAVRPMNASPLLQERLEPMLGLVGAHVRGEFTRASPDHVTWAFAAVLYVVSPWDLTPDYLAGGLRDDELVAAYVLEMIDDTVDRFETWQLEVARREFASSSDRKSPNHRPPRAKPRRQL